MPEPAASPEAADAATKAARAATFRRELRGTAAIIVAIIAIVAAGWIGSALVGRSTATLGPGVTVDFGPGWGSLVIGPVDIWSSRRQLGEVELVVAPFWDGETAEVALERYRDDVISAEMTSITFETPAPRDHPTGAALEQSWTATDADARSVAGELIAVESGQTTVILDGRWPAGTSEATLGELRNVIESLVIVPLLP